MWSRHFFPVFLLTLTIFTTQSHVIHKRGLLSKLFSGNSRSTEDVEANMSPRERSKFRELLKNPVVITMLSAAVGMVVQQALASKNMGDVCDNKYVKMAYTAGNIQPQIQQALNLLGCNAPNRKSNKDSSKNKYGVSTTPGYNNNDEDNDSDNDDDETSDNQNDGTLESSLPPEKHSKLQQLMSVARGEKGAKRNFIKNLFGLGKKDKTFKHGHKLPESTYRLDKDDANSMKEFEKQIEKYH